MNIDTMRRIDRLAGVPLCAIATLLVGLRDALRARTMRPGRRILFVELSEMGSTVLASPAMRKARAQLSAELYFVIFKRNVGSLQLVGTISPDNIFTISDASIFTLARDTLAFLLWTRRKGIDTVVDLELFSRFTALLTGLAGADRRVGFYRFHQEGLYRGEMLTHRVTYNPHIHVAKNFIALIDALLAPKPTIPYAKTVIGDDQINVEIVQASARARGDVLERIRSLAPFDPGQNRLVLINPNASELLPHRRWMPDRFAELIRRILAAYSDVVVLITGAPDEREAAERLAAQNAPRAASFAGHSSLIELPALYSHATLMVTNDSGPAHFSAAVGLPTIVLFGPETPKLYQPLGNSRAIYAGLACSPCVTAHNHRKTACTDNVCMQAISVDEVYAAVAEILFARGAPLMSSAEIAKPVWNPFARLYDALIDPARCERVMALLLVAYAIIWSAYGAIAKSSQDLHFDIGEMFAWSHEVVWSAPTHPPLGPWLMRLWFSVMPVEDWSFYLLAMIVATAALWIAWRLAARYLDPQKRVVGTLLLTFLPFYSFHALKYNASSVLTPFWAVTTWWFLLSFETRRPGWAVLAGVGAATSMLGKYWSIIMLAGLALGALTDPRRAPYFRSAAPWITVAVGAVLLAPHVIYVASHGFSTVAFAMTAHETSFAMAVGWSLYFLVSVLGYIAAPTVLSALATYPSLAAIKDTLWPANKEHRIFVVAFVTPFAVAAIAAVAVRARLDPLWTMSGMTLLPVVLLSSPLLSVNRAAAIRLLALAIVVPLLALAASPAIAIVLHRNSLQNNYGTHYRLIAQAVAKAWREQTNAPLRIVGSFRTVVDGTNPYFPSRPATYAITSPWRTPWVDEARIARDGIAIFCPEQEIACVGEMKKYADQYGAKVENVTLARHYFGTDDTPVKYGIVIIPPK